MDGGGFPFLLPMLVSDTKEEESEKKEKPREEMYGNDVGDEPGCKEKTNEEDEPGYKEKTNEEDEPGCKEKVNTGSPVSLTAVTEGGGKQSAPKGNPQQSNQGGPSRRRL